MTHLQQLHETAQSHGYLNADHAISAKRIGGQDHQPLHQVTIDFLGHRVTVTLLASLKAVKQAAAKEWLSGQEQEPKSKDSSLDDDATVRCATGDNGYCPVCCADLDRNGDCPQLWCSYNEN